jgi:hypothetical protein
MEPKKIFQGELPLQSETNFFILANVLDVYLTYLLLLRGAMEANPLANYVLVRWGFHGMVWFKLSIVAAVCIIAQVIATKRPGTARFLLIVGIMIVAAVVVHSIRLYWIHFR